MKKMMLLLLLSFLSFLMYGQLDRLPANPVAGMCYVSVVTPNIIKTETVSYPVYIGDDLSVKGIASIDIIYEQENTTFDYRKHENGKSFIVCPNKHPEVSEKVFIVKKPKKTQLPFIWKEFEVQVMEKKGGVRKWEQVECEYLDYNTVPVEYSQNETSLSSLSKEALDNYILEWLLETSYINVEILVHYNIGDNEEQNLKIVNQRAEEIKSYLISKGIEKTHIHLTGSVGKRRIAGIENWEGVAFRTLN